MRLNRSLVDGEMATPAVNRKPQYTEADWDHYTKKSSSLAPRSSYFPLKIQPFTNFEGLSRRSVEFNVWQV